MSGLGGCLGGRGWRYPDHAALSATELGLPVAVTEFVAFYGQVEAFGDGVPDEALVMAEVDALATAQSLTDEAAQSPLMQEVFSELQLLPQFVRLRERMLVAHCYGDANILADAFSRGELDTARAICRQMGMAYELQPSPPGVRRLMRRLVQLHLGSTAAGVSNPNIAPSPFAHVRSQWDEYEEYLLAIDDEALAAYPTPEPSDGPGFFPSGSSSWGDRSFCSSPSAPSDYLSPR